MDNEIVTAIWLECKDLTDIERTLLQALAYHCHNTYTCWPSVERLARMLRKTKRHTRRLLRMLEEKGYISVKVQSGRNHPNIYTINRTKLCPPSEKRGQGYVLSKEDKAMSPEFQLEKEGKKGQFLEHLGLTEGSTIWVAALNGHQK
jgi:hypothetical protein